MSSPSTDADSSFKRKTRHCGLVPIPRWVQYDPARPFEYSTLLVCIFGAASTMTVSNLYYAQPLLIQLAQNFGVSYTDVANVPTLTQAGYATGLLFISPLGDLVPRRPLLLILIICSTFLTLGLARAPSLPAFSALTFLVGVSTVTPQVLITLAADLAPPARRGTAIAIVFSGLLLGLMVARVLAGIIAQFSGDTTKGDGWRNVYWMAFGVQAFTGGVLYLVLPDWPAKNKGSGLTYAGIMKSMAHLVVTQPLLVQCSLIGFLGAAIFASFWVTLTFLLGGDPYFYNTVQIGLFGLVGILGVCTAPFVGRFVDTLASPWYATLTALGVLLGFLAIMIGAGTRSVGAVVVTVFGLDLGFQMQQLSNATRIYSISSEMRARLNAIFLICGFVGQVMGTQVGTRVFERSHIPGPLANGALNMGLCGGMLLLLLVRGPWCPNNIWIGGWGYRAPSPSDGKDVEAQAVDKEKVKGKEEKGDGNGESVDVVPAGEDEIETERVKTGAEDLTSTESRGKAAET